MVASVHNTTANNTTTGTSSTSSTSGVNGAATLGGTDFLTLMLAQLKNQDPTSPVDSNTFLTQLAQLSEVQGINSLNTNFGTLSSSLSSSAAMQASSILGHQALVTSDTATTSAAGATVSGAVSVPATTSEVNVTITDAHGNTVKTLYLGAQTSGAKPTFAWDGTTSSGAKAPAGTYNIIGSYAGETSSSTAISTYVSGTVESVSMGSTSSSSGMTVNVSGVGSVPYSSVQQISN